MAELRIPIIGEFKGKKAFDQAGKATTALDRGVKRLGATLLATFSIQKITQFGKAAAKAFIEDEKAAIRLSQAVKNLGLAFETPNIELFITQMASASGIADDQLRPAMQRLLQTTGSLTKSTSLLTQALDISRGSGVDFETVVNDLSMAYVGQTRGLRKYSLGVTQAELKTMSFAEVQERLNKNFTGANAAYLETYAGKMGILGNAAGEASEIIGEGLIESLMILSGDTTVEDLAETMQELATNTAEALNNLSKFGKGIQDTVGPLATVFEKFINATQPIFNSIVFGDALTWAKQPAERPRMGGYPSSALGGAFVDPNAKARKKSEADAVKRAKELAAMQKKAFDTQKKQNALTKASKTLDLERIGIEAALKGQISETDRLSLGLQLALLDKNESQALKLSGQLEAAVKRHKELSAALLATPEAPNPYRNWKPPGFVGPVMPEGVTPPIKNPMGIPYGEQVPNFNVPEWMKQGSAGITGRPAGDYLGLSAIGAGATADTIIKVDVHLGDEVVTNAVTNTQVNQSLSGTFSDVSRYNGRGSVSIK